MLERLIVKEVKLTYPFFSNFKSLSSRSFPPKSSLDILVNLVSLDVLENLEVLDSLDSSAPKGYLDKEIYQWNEDILISKIKQNQEKGL